MARDPRGGGSEEDDIDHKSVKHLLDSIGKKVHEEVINGDAAKKYIEELKGKLSLATLLGVESASTDKPCDFEYAKLISGSGVTARGDPCGSASDKRFSKERVAEYDEKKIRDTNKSKGGNNEGQCAPYRRLSLCNKNFQNINNIDSDKARHNLLAEVCMAAKYEGESIKTHYKQYDAEYPSGSSFTTCTALARSFADIGDIVRGRDLYRGGGRGKGKEKLDDKLKGIFGDIYKDVTRGSNWQALKTRYENDTENYFQLREDWWTANRATIWEAIT
ncbi:hypothetical protein PFFCH_05721 [Plasmodium falciparum FCH/4]|uniref:Uncharacterized protein n=3 Tax=Plasmodium falciparum TaxID=5833 RepID=A0A024VG40_PLAFA|nr:hypothetical protein PFFCH_05721 [Plasmodium falciparum FCH/4]